ncbi:MAG: ArnT family glycosyltransferase [Bacteriovoracaceae bacterium]
MTKNLPRNIQRETLFYFVIFIIYLLGIWDIDAIRQGTETFYLKISKEMLEAKSYMFPLYNGEYHWSKPPFGFWLSFPFAMIFQSDHLFAARLSIVCMTFGLTYLASGLLSGITKKSRFYWFLIFSCSFGFFRYAKIYMLEMPLCLTGFLSMLYLYLSIHNNNRKDFWLSVLFIALASLVKGPVSYAMIFGALGVYFLFNKSLINLKNISHVSKILFASLAIASLWYLYCYFHFKDEFINYFFLRENLGKFKSQSYSPLKLIQGIFLFSIPWSFSLLFVFNKNLRNRIIALRQIQKNSTFYKFTLASFIVFFLLWFIPSQRSHHYAIPALPFFLILIEPAFDFFKKHLLKYVGMIFYALLGAILLFAALIDPSFFKPSIFLSSLAIIVLCLFFFQKKLSENQKVLIFTLSLSITWSLLIPNFVLPKIPNDAIEKMGNANLMTIFKKNYYFEEVLEGDVRSIAYHNVHRFIRLAKYKDTYFIFTEYHFKQFELAQMVDIQQVWPVWKRKIRFKDLIYSLRNRNSDRLKDSYILFKPKAK